VLISLSPLGFAYFRSALGGSAIFDISGLLSSGDSVAPSQPRDMELFITIQCLTANTARRNQALWALWACREEENIVPVILL
jgi:hypothetical protein